MVTVEIDEVILLDMLMDRVEHWTDEAEVQKLYEDYYRDLVYSGCFEDCKLDIYDTVDNDYINYTTVISKDDFNQYNIKDETDDKIITFNKEEDLYLIKTY